ncbi:MAG TPA: redoxin domain-containing protein [Polyangiaceae bacterium]
MQIPARVLLSVLTAALLQVRCAGSSPPVRAMDDPPGPVASTNSPAAAPGPVPGSEQEEERGERVPAWLGVELALREPGTPGVLVRGVVPGSPAERAGMMKDDVILGIDGQGVGRPSDVVALVSSRGAGERIGIALRRGERERLLAATLEPLPNDEALMKRRYVDNAAPALATLTTVRGSVSPSLRELRGNVVVIEFWAGWCVPCRITAPLLSRWNDLYSAEGLRVLGVTSDPVVEAADAAQRHGMTYSVFTDESGATTLSYRAFALPTLFVIDRRGVVRDVMVGFSSTRLKEVESLLTRLLAER